ncbi:MAG: NAD-dependent epimerase/dehydratase family protein [Saprospiraceae bacterium]|nr:NAD-dependent epimerase/dehydratase family protein [Saprospiraceae bacterium]
MVLFLCSERKSMAEKILMIGSNGQIGTVLSKELRKKYGGDNVICSDIREPIKSADPFLIIDVLDKAKLQSIIHDHSITQIYHLAALLSAKGEQNPELTWKINMQGLLNVLDLSVQENVKKVFFPSSIAIYGPTTPKINTPQYASFQPTTIYGISKIAGEMWCEYYYKRYKLDVRSIRYPGVIGWQSLPEGGTTDYAVEIFHAALKSGHYDCFLAEHTALPMIYMDDAIRATLELMEANAESITVRTSYNLVGMSFTPGEIYSVIKNKIPNFTIQYKPDFRQKIAESWTESIDDSYARKDWGWKPNYDLDKMCEDMIAHLKQ